MDKIVVGFVGGNTNLDRAIKYFSDSEEYDITHAFTMILNSTCESRGIKEKSDPYAGVWLHSPDKFCTDSTSRFIELDIPNIHGAENMARFLIGSAYGFSSCLAFFLRKVFGINFPDNKHSCNCSETQALILRAGGLDVYPNMNVNEISPLQMFQWVVNYSRLKSGACKSELHRY